MASETIEVTGHIVDSLLLAKILDSILDAGFDYEITDVAIGKTSLDPSRARIDVTGDDEVLGRLVGHPGARRQPGRHRAPRWCQPTATGSCAAGFCSTTNLASGVASTAPGCRSRTPRWTAPLVVRDGQARTVPMHRVAPATWS